jgi:hypothetical protein
VFLETADGDLVAMAKLDVDYFGEIDDDLVPQELRDAELTAKWSTPRGPALCWPCTGFPSQQLLPDPGERNLVVGQLPGESDVPQCAGRRGNCPARDGLRVADTPRGDPHVHR